MEVRIGPEIVYRPNGGMLEYRPTIPGIDEMLLEGTRVQLLPLLEDRYI
jgi:hypothetical protein